MEGTTSPPHRLSSLRKQGPIYQLARGVSWVPAFAGMTPSFGVLPYGKFADKRSSEAPGAP
jgi:hypothetical protein